MARTPPEAYFTALKKKGFELGDWIGGGAYGNVYRARQVSLNRPVAVKFYDNRFTMGEANRKRFDREAPLLARVQHPAVPYVITTGIILSGDIPYTVMEYVDGISLRRRLESGRPMDTGAIHRVMRDVLSALDCAHRSGVVHRDVKPDNILLSADGTYLIDFSIGICLSYEPGLTRATNVGQGVGSTGYAAPEQLHDATTVDGRADIYSAGVVLAEMLGARPPVGLDRLDQELAAVPASVVGILRRALAARPDERFQRVGDFLSVLEGLVGPPDVNLRAPRIVLCPKPGCSGGKWSNGNRQYFWGPKVAGPTTDRFCDACGSEYVGDCPKCHSPLPSNIAALVVKEVKSQPDALEAHCPRCGELIFRTPTCGLCNSYLKLADLGRDTTKDGCSKCAPARGAPSPTGHLGNGTSSGDDDIPF